MSHRSQMNTSCAIEQENFLTVSAAHIIDAEVQAAMQPWAEMECYQLSSGKQLAKMDVLNMGEQQ